jgi:hypothetical protein
MICFDICDETQARRSIAIIDTRPDRFEGYKGDRPVIVTARFQSNCAWLPDVNPRGRPIEFCPDLFSHRFIEVNSAVPANM